MTSPDAVRFPFETPPQDDQAVTVAPGVFWLRLPLPMALDHVNVYALDDGDGWTLVDTGFDTARTRALWQAIMAGPLGGRPVRRVIVTHYHPDHIGLAGWFQQMGAELLTTRTSWLYARMLVLDVQTTHSAAMLAFQRRAGVPEERLAQMAQERPFNFADVVAPLPIGFTRLCEGQVITAAGRRWRVRTGDGHAPEHATLWGLDDNLILGGDQLLPGISANIGVYPTEPAADPLTEWLDSCARFMPLARPDHLVLPGHKLPFTGLPFRLAQMVENHEQALLRLHAHLAHPRAAVDCFGPLFKRDIDAASHGMALIEAVAHLNCLAARGLAHFVTDAQGRDLWQALPPART